MLDFRLLGPLEVVGGDGPLKLGGIRQRATLAILLLSANRVVPIDRFADDLYGGEPPVTAVTQVQRQVSELRKLLGAESSIETRSPGYVITLDPGQIDLQRFERWMGEGTASLADGDALDVYRGLRRRFVNELGIEPTPSLRALEQGILRHDAELAAPASRVRDRTAAAPVLVVANDVSSAANLLSAAASIAGPTGEVV